jgi:exosortase A
MLNTLIKNKNFILLMAVLLSIPAIFFATTLSVVDVWLNNDSFTHGFLIFPISIWLIYEKRNQLNVLPISPEPRAILLLIIFIFAWLMANLVGIQLVQQLSVIFIILISILIIFGRAILAALFFPLGFLFFSVPMGGSLIEPMMELTANFTVIAVQLTGIPIYRDGLLFSLPTGNWSVVEACSGVNYLIASLTLGTLYAYITYNSNLKRMTFVVIALVVAAIANGLRAFGIVMIGHHSDMQYGTGGDHTFYGWIFYGFIIMLLFYFGSFWADKIKIEKLVPIQTTTTHPYGIALFVTIILISIQLIPGIITNKIIENKELAISIIVPDNFSGWQIQSENGLNWEPSITNPDSKIKKSYRFGQDIVQIAIGYYSSQTQGSEAVSFQNRLTSEASDWKKTNDSDLAIDSFYVKETELKLNEQRLLVWNWYLIGNYETPSPFIAKLMNIINIIIYQRNDASFITIATPIIKDKSKSRQQLTDFIKDAKGDLIKQLTGAVNTR